MRLQYIWVENYKCLKNIGYNFTGKYFFSMEEGFLTYKNKSEEYIEGIFSDNTDISIFVGENGAGKTTLLKSILSLCYGYSAGFTGEKIVVFEDTEKEESCFYVYKSGNVKISSKLEKSSVLKDINDLSKEDDTLYVYYSPFIQNISEVSQKYSWAGSRDISTGFLLKSKEQEVQSKQLKFPISEFLNDEYTKQITFFSEEKELIKRFEIRYPEYALITVVNKAALINSDRDNFSIDPNIMSLIGKIEKIQPDIIDRDSFITAVAQNILFCFLNHLTAPVLQPYSLNFTDIDDQVSLYSIKAFFTGRSIKGSVYEEYGKACVDFLDYLEGSVSDQKKYFQSAYWKISIRNEADGEYIVSGLEEFFTKYKETVLGSNYLSFSWPLSSGEYTILSMISRFYELKEENKTINNVKILLDEAETSLHPEWQRRYLSILSKAMKSIFKDKSIQMIFATHSPIILSDVPRQNVVFLTTKKEIGYHETFGANIYDLYHDEFFMDDYFGEFAKEKIMEVINSIYIKSGRPKTSEDYGLISYENAKERITLIGDDFIKKELRRIVKEIERQENQENV